MDAHEYTSDPHRMVANRVAQGLAARTTVEAVLLAGSVARGEHLPTSDVDLLVLDTDTTDAMRQITDETIDVEIITHTEQAWIDRFDRPKSSWLYAFLDATVLYQFNQAGKRLKDQAERARVAYTASDALRQELASTLWHGQAKLARAAGQDEMTQGFWAAICVDTVLDGLYTIHNVPLPAGSRRMAYLNNVPLRPDEKRLLEQYLTGTTTQRFDALIHLTGHLRAHLAPTEHQTARVVTSLSEQDHDLAQDSSDSPPIRG